MDSATLQKFRGQLDKFSHQLAEFEAAMAQGKADNPAALREPMASLESQQLSCSFSPAALRPHETVNQSPTILAGATAVENSSSLSVGQTKRKGVENGVVLVPSEERPSKRIRKTARMSTGGKAPRRKREVIDLTWMFDG